MATLAQPSDLRNTAPELATLTDPELQIYIDMADAEINEDAWGSRAKIAETLLACHYTISLRSKGGGVGPIVGTRVGDVSVQYANPSSPNGGLDPLDATAYGVAYRRLVKLAGMGVATTGGG